MVDRDETFTTVGGGIGLCGVGDFCFSSDPFGYPAKALDEVIVTTILRMPSYDRVRFIERQFNCLCMMGFGLRHALAPSSA